MPTLEHFAGLREGLLLDADYLTLDGRATVRLWVRSEGRALQLLDARFEPYLYVVVREEADLPRVHEALRRLDAGGARPVRVEVVERREGLRTLKVLKVTAHHPQDVPRLRDAVKGVAGVVEHREADIPFAFRYLIDHDLRPMGGIAFDAQPEGKALRVRHVEPREAAGVEPDLRVLAFDLEVYNPRIVPRVREDPILLISVATSTGRVEVLQARPGPRGDEEPIQRFLDLLRAEDPDVIVTYNGDEFDWPYLVERARLHGLRMDVGRDGSEPRSRQAGLHRVVSIAGRENVDLLRIAQRDLGDVKVKTLKNVADFLGVTNLGDRVVVRKERIHALWDDAGQRATLLAYARDDAVSTLELARKLLPLQYELARMTRMPLDEESKMGRGKQVDWFLLAEAHRRGMLAPGKAFVRDEVYEGGLVLEPARGLHEDIVALDFSSMYPSIMVAHNVSPETFVPDEVAKAFRPEELWQAPEVGHRFLRQPVGFFPAIVEELVQTRKRWKQAMRATSPGSPEHAVANVKQQTLKILTNAFYGYTGWAGARWHKRECAEATTAWGRAIVRSVIDEARAQGLEVLYGDSVTRERFITVRTPEGRILPVNVEALFQRLTPMGVRSRGGKEEVPGGGFEALTWDPARGAPAWQPILRVIRHDAGKRVFRVAQKLGETRVTEDHGVMTAVGRGAPLEPTRPTEVAGRTMFRVPVPRADKDIETIDLHAALGGYRTTWIARGRERTAEVRLRGDRLAFLWSDREQPITLPRYVTVGSPESAALCRLVGAYVAEGSASTPETTRTRMGASIANSDVAWLRRLQADYHLLFHGARSCIIRSTRGVRTLRAPGKPDVVYEDKTSKLQMMNKLAAVFFRELCGQGSHGKRLPDFAFNIPEEHQRLILRTMVEGDGSRKFGPRYSAAYQARHFTYTTSSLELACGLSLLLGQLGMHHSLQYRPGKGSYTIRTGDRPNARVATRVHEEAYTGPVYDLEVAGTHTFVDSCGQVLLHNTDSLFVKDDPRIPAFLARVNEQQPLELDVQERFDVLFFTGAKKRYAGLTKDGKVVARGLEVRRGDWCELAKELQEGVLDQVLRSRDPQGAVRLARDAVQRVLRGEASVEELTIYKTLTMDPGEYKAKQAHVHALERAQRVQPDYKAPPGTKIGYVIVQPRGALKGALPSERAVLVDFLQGEEPDAQYYVDKQLVPAALRILEHFGFGEADLKGAPRQQSLRDWF